MRTLTRRVFVRCSAALGALLAAGRRAAHGIETPQRGSPPGAAPGLDAKALLPLAHAVLPSELRAAGVERATNEFARWIAGYREGEETLHPYGSDRLGRTGASPAAKWAEQLAALDRAAAAQKGKPFSDLAVADRTALVRDALSSLQLTARIPSVVGAPHVALALLAHFLDSPDATNLCYSKRIDPQTCRPLKDLPREPLPLARPGPRSPVYGP